MSTASTVERIHSTCFIGPLTDHQQKNTTFFVSFQSTIANALSTSGTTVILGDFNVNHRQWNATDVDTAEGKQLAGLLDDLALQQIVRNTATRYSATGSQSSLLDLGITDAEHRISDLEVLDPLSDHCPIIFKYLSGKRTPKHPPPRFVPDYANTDFQSLRQKLSSLPLRECMLGASEHRECVVGMGVMHHTSHCQLFSVQTSFISKTANQALVHPTSALPSSPEAAPFPCRQAPPNSSILVNLQGPEECIRTS